MNLDKEEEGIYPLQLIREPIAPASLQPYPLKCAAAAQDKNLERMATVMMRTTYPQVIPLLSRLRFVFNPDRVKYCVRQM